MTFGSSVRFVSIARAADWLIHGHVIRMIGRYNQVHEINADITLFWPRSFCLLGQKSMGYSQVHEFNCSGSQCNIN